MQVIVPLSSRAVFSAGTSAFKQYLLRTLVPALKTARDDNKEKQDDNKKIPNF